MRQEICPITNLWMKKEKVKFNVGQNPEFFQVLRSRVNHYFKEKGISSYSNLNMKVKTIFMLSLYIVPYILMIFQVVDSVWWMFLMWVLMGFGMSGIGLSIMHDANHGAYSRNKWVNKALGWIINMIGGYHTNWKIQHNVLHHTYTNIHGHDEDIAKEVIRMSPDQVRKPYHRFQVYYAPFLYGIMTIYWLVAKDIQQLFRYHKRGLLKAQKKNVTNATLEIVSYKLIYILVFIILPIYLLSYPWLYIVSGFLLMQFISGMILALIFQPAHVIQETEFFKPDEQGSVENNWAIHQLKTTSNFANGSRLFSWLIGGLNYQIEHHLFPHICHVHYRGISKIVRQTAGEFDLPYHHHTTFFKAVGSHFSLLNRLGKSDFS